MRARQFVPLESLAAALPNAMATGPFGSSIGASTFRPSGVPVIRGSNLSADIGKRLIDNGLIFIEQHLARQFERSAVTVGDLVFTCWGTINQVGFIDQLAKYSRYIVSNKQMKFTADPKKADSLFLYYWFSSPQGQEDILSGGIGSSVPGFNLGQLRKMKVPLLPLAEQQSIATLLGALDDRIELKRRMNATVEAMARALFKDWFVDFGPTRAKMEGRAPYLAADIWSLFPDRFDHDEKPEGWKGVPFSSLFEINPPEQLPRGKPAPYLDMAALPTSGPNPEPFLVREFGSGMRFRNGDALLARITPCLENGKTAFVQNLPENQVAWGSTEFIVLRSRPPLPKAVAYLVARDPAFRANAIRSMTGTSGRQRASSGVISTYPLTTPANDLLWSYLDELLVPMFGRIAANDLESQTLAATRDLLLPKLMSGEVRIREAERLVEAVA